jgi:hypothetical protein
MASGVSFSWPAMEELVIEPIVSDERERDLLHLDGYVWGEDGYLVSEFAYGDWTGSTWW